MKYAVSPRAAAHHSSGGRKDWDCGVIDEAAIVGPSRAVDLRDDALHSHPGRRRVGPHWPVQPLTNGNKALADADACNSRRGGYGPWRHCCVFNLSAASRLAWPDSTIA